MSRSKSRAKVGVGIVALALALLVVAAARSGGRAADGALIAKADFVRLEREAKDLAAKGCAAETEVLLDVLARLGEGEAGLAKMHDACSKSLAAAKGAASGAQVAGLVRSLHATASDLCKRLAALGAVDACTLAEQILRIDDDQPLAHQALGHEFVKAPEPPAKTKPDAKAEAGIWLSPEQNRVRARRREINAAIVRARRLEIPLEVAPSDFEPLHAIDPSPATVVRYGVLQFHSTMAPEQLQRIVRRGLQAMALSQFLRGSAVLQLPVEVPGYFSYPLHTLPCTFVLLTSKEKYDRSIDLAMQSKGIWPHEVADDRAHSGYLDRRSFYLLSCVGEVEYYCLLASLLGPDYLRAFTAEQQPCLVKGHLQWICQSLFGSALPGSVREPVSDLPGAAGTTSDRKSDSKKEKRARQVAHAGISGARRWMVFKAERGEDPPWSNSFVASSADLFDLDLVKSTFVVEYLQELSTFDELLRNSGMNLGEKSLKKQIEEQLSGGLPEFEARFHAWLLPREAGIVQSLAKPPAPEEPPTSEEKSALAALDRFRKTMWDAPRFGEFEPMQIDRELSASCAAHAHYLTLHPEQLERWPDAHEEYADKEGFTSEGCWAGMHSVIWPGVTGADDAVARWMGTFYHRLPLLEPGLKRIGFALKAGTAVLDADSLVVADAYEGSLLWPARDSKDVPTRFAPGGELPSPVPGVDEREFGYPITLQTARDPGEVELVLTKGATSDGPVVPGFLSTPSHPTNVDAAPAGAFCLLPKARLDSQTIYSVTARFADGTPSITWSFTTGD